MSHLVQSLFDFFFFCQPRVFLLVMLTTEIIFLAQNFPVNLPHWCKLPVLLPRPFITGSRRADIQQKINLVGCMLKGINFQEKEVFVLFYKALLFTCGGPFEVMDYFLKIEVFGLAQFSVPGKHSVCVVELNA